MQKIFIDCGAHCGESILEAKKRFGDDIKVISFEANPNLAIPLQEHFKNDSNVEINNAAVWIEDKKSTKFYLSVNWSDGSSIYKEKKSGGISDNISVDVPSIDLSKFIRDLKKDNYIILKLDVEGAEYEILNHLIDENTFSLIDEFHGEFHPGKIDKPELKELEDKIYKHFNQTNTPFYNWELVGNQPKAIARGVWKDSYDIKPITFVIPSRNNLEFLQLAYKSIRNLKGAHEILVLNDASTDGTQEWIDGLDDDDIIVHHNPGPERIGIVGMFDKGIEMARTDIIMAFHADMIAGPNLDENILKHLERGKVVSATRVEPPLHPPGPEKITMNFHKGAECEAYNFDWNSFFSWAENIGLKDTKTTEGVFAPWCMYKEDFLAINGHDELFAPQSKEDSDIFNRMQLAGYKFVQPWDALVYHFTSRGSRFNKHAGGAAGKNSDEWLYTTNKNMRNFIRKWGTVVLHDSSMKPIIRPKYNTQFIIENGTPSLLQALEPWCDNINIDIDASEIEKYIKEEQPNTIIDLTKRINQNVSNDIQITFDGNKFTENSYGIIQQISAILESNEIEAGEFELDIFRLKVNKVKTYEHTLISAD